MYSWYLGWWQFTCPHVILFFEITCLHVGTEIYSFCPKKTNIELDVTHYSIIFRFVVIECVLCFGGAQGLWV